MRRTDTRLRFLTIDERGAVAIEYAVLAAVVSLIAIGGVVAFGDSLIVLYENWTAAANGALSTED